MILLSQRKEAPLSPPCFKAIYRTVHRGTVKKVRHARYLQHRSIKKWNPLLHHLMGWFTHCCIFWWCDSANIGPSSVGRTVRSTNGQCRKKYEKLLQYVRLFSIAKTYWKITHRRRSLWPQQYSELVDTKEKIYNNHKAMFSTFNILCSILKSVIFDKWIDTRMIR